MKVTADTITDEQIRKLRTSLKRLLSKLRGDELAEGEAKADIESCTIALTDRRSMAFMVRGVAEGVRKARAHCADILNSRGAS